MKIKSSICALTTVLAVSGTFAATYTPTLSEHLAILAVSSQIFKKMDYERKEFIKNVRPYTFEEDSDYICSAIIGAKDLINLANKYPQYRQDVAVQNYVKQNQNLINTLEQGVIKEKRTCKGYVVRMPTVVKGATPIEMSATGAAQKFQQYYSTRDNMLVAINFENDPTLRKKKICELSNFSTNTEMNLLLYRDVANSPDGKKVLSQIEQDRQGILKPKSIADRC